MSKRVLVVDDDENTVKFLSIALREGGYDPLESRSVPVTVRRVSSGSRIPAPI